MEENIVFGILILASIAVFIISLYIVIPILILGDEIKIEKKRRKELDKFLMSRGIINNEDTLPTDA
jgi:hypothetical protein